MFGGIMRFTLSLVVFVCALSLALVPTQASAKKRNLYYPRSSIEGLIDWFEARPITAEEDPLFDEYRKIDWTDNINLNNGSCAKTGIDTTELTLVINKVRPGYFLGRITEHYCDGDGGGGYDVEGYYTTKGMMIVHSYKFRSGPVVQARWFKIENGGTQLRFTGQYYTDKKGVAYYEALKPKYNFTEKAVQGHKNYTSHYQSEPNAAIRRTINARAAARARGPRDPFDDFLRTTTQALQAAAGQMAAANRAQSSWAQTGRQRAVGNYSDYAPNAGNHSVGSSQTSTQTASRNSGNTTTTITRGSDGSISVGADTGSSANSSASGEKVDRSTTWYAFTHCYEEFATMGKRIGAVSDVFAYKVDRMRYNANSAMDKAIAEFDPIEARQSGLRYDRRKCNIKTGTDQARQERLRASMLDGYREGGGGVAIHWRWVQRDYKPID